jgi:coenzyme F420 biosynthesis associated uncharacterized protein
VAKKLAEREPPLSEYERRSLEADFEEMTARAEGLVEAETGLVSLAGPARSRVTDRSQWVDVNVASFQRLLRPVATKLAARMEAGGRRSLRPEGLTRQMSGAELGLILGWMSGRVLGQYDQLLIEDECPDEQDMVYYVGTNVVGVERRHGFAPREFRLWLALHEVTHRAQFTGVPWLRDHFLTMVDKTLDGIDIDPRQLASALQRGAQSFRSGRNPLEEGGLLTLLAGPEQYEAILSVGALMSLLEGHGDVTMDRAAAGAIPSAALFSSTLHARRRQRGLARVLSVLIGLEAKMRQYQQGENFIAAVEAQGGPALLSKVWDGPQWLPGWDEIRNPDVWVARVHAPGGEATVA